MSKSKVLKEKMKIKYYVFQHNVISCSFYDEKMYKNERFSINYFFCKLKTLIDLGQQTNTPIS